MFCYKCGKQILDESRFCPECGAQIGVNENSVEVHSNETAKTIDSGIEKTKTSFLRKMISPKIYYPAMLILVALAVILGKNQMKKDIDLAQFIGKSEQEVAKMFGVEMNEMSLYPDDSAIVVACSDGTVETINVSSSASKYSFEGFRYGDAFEKSAFDSKYEFYESAQIDGSTLYVYEVNGSGGSLTILEDGNKNIEQIMYMRDLSASEAMYGTGSDTLEVAEDSDSSIENNETSGINDIDFELSGEYVSWNGQKQLYLDIYDEQDIDGSIGNMFMYEGENLIYDTPYYLSPKEPDDFQGCYERTYIFYDNEGYPYYLGFKIENGEICIDYDSETRTIEYFQKVDDAMFEAEGGYLYTAVVTAPDGYVNIRSGAGTDYDIISTANTGELMDVYEENGDWLKINYHETIGWVHKSQIDGVQ